MVKRKIKNVKEQSVEFNDIRIVFGKFSKKYSLPDFDKLNEDFDISKIECDPNMLLRDIRKIMSNKFSSVMNFIELLLNPSNGSMFNMFLVRGVNSEEKEILDELFSKIGGIGIEAFELDIYYSEAKEAEFVKSKFNDWQEIKPKLETIVKSLKGNWRKESGKKTKSYFG